LDQSTFGAPQEGGELVLLVRVLLAPARRMRARSVDSENECQLRSQTPKEQENLGFIFWTISSLKFAGCQSAHSAQMGEAPA